MKLVILDRDGTINHDSDQYIKSPLEWKPIPGSLEAIARLTHAGWRVVVATNGYASELLPDLDIRPARGQVLLTSSVPGLRLRGTFHMNEGYFYFRDLHGAILLGGGRILDLAGEATTEDGVTDQIQSALEEMLRDVILAGRTFTIEQRWSGIMGFRSTGKTPLVEYVSPRVIAAVGLSGMGVAIGIRVARNPLLSLLSDLN